MTWDPCKLSAYTWYVFEMTPGVSIEAINQQTTQYRVKTVKFSKTPVNCLSNKVLTPS